MTGKLFQNLWMTSADHVLRYDSKKPAREQHHECLWYCSLSPECKNAFVNCVVLQLILRMGPEVLRSSQLIWPFRTWKSSEGKLLAKSSGSTGSLLEAHAIFLYGRQWHSCCHIFCAHSSFKIWATEACGRQWHLCCNIFAQRIRLRFGQFVTSLLLCNQTASL